MIDIIKVNLKRLFILLILVYLFHEFLIMLTGASPTAKYIVSIREYALASNYLHAGQANIKSLGKENSKKWLCHLLKHEGLAFFFVQKNNGIISCIEPNNDIRQLQKDLNNSVIHSSLLKHKDMIVVYNNPEKSDKSLLMATKSTSPSWFKAVHLKGSQRIALTVVSSFLILAIFFYLIGNPLIYLRKKVHSFSKERVSPRTKDKPHTINEIQMLDESFMKMSKDIEKIIENKQGVLEMISHEIKSPLARQKAALNLVNKGIDSKSNLARAHKENENIANLVSEIFSYIKVNQKQFKLNYRTFNLNNVIVDIIEDLSYEYDATNITFIEENTLDIKADITLLSVAIQNVISNALKYSGTVKPITVNLTEEGDEIIILISDNGPGVAKVDLVMIFEPFFRAYDNVNTISGSGLGLSFTKKVIELHNGRVMATINDNNGLTISITLPTSL